MTILYGIPNCDKVCKARGWLTYNQIDFDFFNFKSQTLETSTIKLWLEQFTWQDILNTRSTTWRNLPVKPEDQTTAIKLMQDQPTIIKRPIMQFNSTILISFDPEQYQKIIKDNL